MYIVVMITSLYCDRFDTLGASMDSQEVAPHSVESCNNPSSVVGSPPISIYQLTPTTAEMPHSSQLKDIVSNSNENTQEIVSSEGRDVAESSPNRMKKDFPNEKSIENSSDVYEFNDDSCTSETPIVTPSNSTRKRKGAMSEEDRSEKIKKMFKDVHVHVHGGDDVQIIPQSRKRKLDGAISNNKNNILSKSPINQKYPLTSNIADDCCSSLSSWSSVEEDNGTFKSTAGTVHVHVVEMSYNTEYLSSY